MSADVIDLAIVGAGPAGLAAAVTAADAGCSVVILDLGARIGGQYYRHAADAQGALHHNWRTFVRLRDRVEAHVRAERVVHLPGHAVWSVDRRETFVVRALAGERTPRGRVVRARGLVVATGAHDRHVPFPGWTLPGVMAVGGVQSLLKGSGVAGRRIVVAGTGPFLLSVADGLLMTGVEVPAVVEANAARRYLRELRSVAGAAAKIPEAVGYGARLVRHRVPYLTRHAVVAAHGDGRLEAVSIARVDEGWHPVPGTVRRVPCDTLAVGYGFTPQIDLLLALGCEPARAADGAAVVAVDRDQRTSVAGLYAVGETTGVGGADLALAEGELAGAAAARELVGAAQPLDARVARRLHRRRTRLRRFADTLHAVHPVRDGWTTWLDDATVVCRCEEVTLAGLREAVCELGAGDARSVKLLARPGMGWCQGRICGTACADLTAALQHRPVTQAEREAMAQRPIAQPVPLEVLAAVAEESDTSQASSQEPVIGPA
jgi:NADPH-dependent 2,4-dienoyl-CoA reductase/sulfur reductase-like enzyme